MQARGHSLVEMIVIIAIISAVLAIATMAFSGYFTRYKSEAQMRMIYDELMNARANAICHSRSTRVKIYATRFEVYSSLTDDGAAPVVSRQLQYPLIKNGSGPKVDFDQRGITFDECSLCIQDGYETGSVDSVLIGNIRIRMGKRDPGPECDAKHITIQ